MLYGVRIVQHGIPASSNKIYQHSELALGIHVVIHSSFGQPTGDSPGWSSNPSKEYYYP